MPAIFNTAFDAALILLFSEIGSIKSLIPIRLNALYKEEKFSGFIEDEKPSIP